MKALLLFTVACMAGAIAAPIAIAAPGFSISSPAFSEGAPIPPIYSRKGRNVSPPLELTGAPAGAKTFAVILDDPDAAAGIWLHWLVANIPGNTKKLAEGRVPNGAVVGKNSWNATRYDGPQPPSGTHRYIIRAFALDAELSLSPGFDRAQLEKAMKGHVLASAQTTGTFSSSNNAPAPRE